ncbi:hypothetical protein ACJX0J_021345, partial [Zea mays]
CAEAVVAPGEGLLRRLLGRERGRAHRRLESQVGRRREQEHCPHLRRRRCRRSLADVRHRRRHQLRASAPQDHGACRPRLHRMVRLPLPSLQ